MDISKISLPNGEVRNIKDAQARLDIQNMQSSVAGAMHFVGASQTAISDNSAVTPININGQTYMPVSGDVVLYNSMEYVWSSFDRKWHEFGSTGSLRGLAFKDTASGGYRPTGRVTVSPLISLYSESVTPIKTVGTLPSLSVSVDDEVMTLSFDAGTLPTTGMAINCATGVRSITASANFVGNAETITVS